MCISPDQVSTEQGGAVTPGPAVFNACDYLLDRHIRAGRGDRLVLTGVAGDLSYAELADRVAHAARGLRGLGLQAEQRVVMVMTDSPEFVVVYLATIGSARCRCRSRPCCTPTASRRSWPTPGPGSSR